MCLYVVLVWFCGGSKKFQVVPGGSEISSRPDLSNDNTANCFVAHQHTTSICCCSATLQWNTVKHRVTLLLVTWCQSGNIFIQFFSLSSSSSFCFSPAAAAASGAKSYCCVC